VLPIRLGEAMWIDAQRAGENVTAQSGSGGIIAKFIVLARPRQRLPKILNSFLLSLYVFDFK
jgi:hypothetical protein